jgi:5-methylcytosine-specific restriction endonuclease McrA
MNVLCSQCKREFRLISTGIEKYKETGLCGKCRNRNLWLESGYEKYKKTKPCPECGKPILLESMFCYSCTQIGSRNRKYTNGWSVEERHCTTCSKLLTTGSKTGICKECYIEFLKSPENPRHKFKKAGRKFYDEPEYLGWKLSVLTRDNWTCALCSKKERQHANAHHIRPKRDFPELAFDTNNGITLCRSCHRKLNSHEYEYIETFEKTIMAVKKLREPEEPCKMGISD